MKVYVASSWRNDRQPEVVAALRKAGHKVYDFRNPPNKTGFSWSEIDPNWKNWTVSEYLTALDNPIAANGFLSDFEGMREADVCVLVMPCGRSAHCEAGYMQGAGKPTIVLLEKEAEPELMYKMFERVRPNLEEVVKDVNFLESLSLANIKI